MGASDSAEIILDVATNEAIPNERIEEKLSRMTKRQSSAFSSKVMRELMEMQFRDDMAFLDKKEMQKLMKILESSSVDDERQFRGNEKMRELMQRKFSSSVDDLPFCDNMVHVLHSVLYEVVCDKNADADRFVWVLEQACKENEVDLATIFSHVTPKGDSLLHVAVEHGNEEVVRLIAFHYPKLLYKTNIKGDTPLHAAARSKNLIPIKNILDMEKHFVITSSEKEEEGEFKDDKVEFLMLRNNHGMTALHEAVLSKNYCVVLFLLLAHIGIDVSTYWTWNFCYGCKSPMYLAAQTRAENILHLLLSRIPIPKGNAISNGDSPLHAAILERTQGLLKMIVDTRKELLYQRDEKNNTPLHYAAYAGYLEAVSIMLQKSPMVAFQRNSDGNLPIHLACEKGKVEVVKKLLEMEWSNAGVFLNNKSQNILHVAAMKGKTKVIKYLLKQPKIHDHTLNERDENGETPLHLAARGLRLWTLLLFSHDKRIDMNIVNNQGFTARDVVWMQRRIPRTTQEVLANSILMNAWAELKATKMLGTPHTITSNKEWNVKKAGEILMLVAILIATVTFTAGFTVPGGFYSSDGPISKERGMALLSNQTLFKIFTAFNTIAMYSSTIGSVILLWVPVGDLRLASHAFVHAQIFVQVALIAMAAAFLAAIRLIVSNNTLLALVITLIGSISVFIFIFFLILQLFPIGSRIPLLHPIADLIIRTIIFFLYGPTDFSDSDVVGKVNQS